MGATSAKTLVTAATFVVVGVALIAGLRSTTTAQNQGHNQGHVFWGTWVLALDSTPFGIPGGTLPGVMTIHQDGTLSIADGGDIGSFPLTTTDIAQRGVWTRTGQTIKGVTLWLRKDEVSGEIEGWHRGRFSLWFDGDNDHLAGVAEEDVLACNPTEPTPFKLLNCPDPTTTAFALAPFQIPIHLTRLRMP